MKTNTLLIWNEINNDSNIYFLIDNVEMEMNGWLPLLLEAHGNLINENDMNDGLEFLSAAVTDVEYIDNDGYFSKDTKREWRCALAKMKITEEELLEDNNITRVISSGFVF